MKRIILVIVISFFPRQSFGGGSITFNGTDTWINVGDVLDMGLNDWTVSVDFNTTSTAFGGLCGKVSYRLLAGRWSTAINETAEIHCLIDWGDGGQNPTTSATPYANGSWHQETAIYNRNGNLTLYLDTINKGNLNITLGKSTDMQSTDLLFIGVYGNTTGDGPRVGSYFNGRLAHIRVFNRALTLDEIQELSICADSPVNGLVGNWTMLDDKSHYDLSVNNNDGINNGAIVTSQDGPPLNFCNGGL